jgi:hypothetical protein
VSWTAVRFVIPMPRWRLTCAPAAGLTLPGRSSPQPMADERRMPSNVDRLRCRTEGLGVRCGDRCGVELGRSARPVAFRRQASRWSTQPGSGDHDHDQADSAGRLASQCAGPAFTVGFRAVRARVNVSCLWSVRVVDD